jgi:hypothetical protein
MKPDEIRAHWNVQGRYPAELIGDFALVEIAAQLAELNENLDRLNQNFEMPVVSSSLTKVRP